MSKSTLDKEIALSIEFVKMAEESFTPTVVEYEANPEAIEPSKRLSKEEFNAKRQAEAEEQWRSVNTIEARLGAEAKVWKNFVQSMPKTVVESNKARAERASRRATRMAIWTRAERRFLAHTKYCEKYGLEPVAVQKTPADVAKFYAMSSLSQ